MISIRDLNYSYDRRSALFQNLSVEMAPGKIIGLLGKNGSGKTSLLKLLSGLLYPDSGSLSVLGLLPSHRQPSLMRHIYFIPEEIYLPSVTIGQYIKANSALYPGFDHSLIEGMLTQCELQRQHALQKLSYGQKKKFLITFALSTKCKLLLLDEPTNGLDIPSKSVFRKMVAGSLDKDQLVIISTHQVKDVENLIDRIIILDRGSIILNMDSEAVSAKLQFVRKESLDEAEVLYSEAIPGGFNVISKAPSEPSAIDMELLFNAVTSGKQIL